MNKQAKNAFLFGIILVATVAIVVALTFVSAAQKKCNNGVDDDNDGLVDYPNDPGCSSVSDNNEHGSFLVCDDGLDATNDADTLKDFQISGGDLGCTSATDTSEIDGPCDNLVDDDGDGLVDFPADPECSNYADVEHECGDTDGGLVVAVQGTTSGRFGGTPFSGTDFCIDNATVKEHYCNPYNLGSQNIGCNTNLTTVCSNGACV